MATKIGDPALVAQDSPLDSAPQTPLILILPGLGVCMRFVAEKRILAWGFAAAAFLCFIFSVTPKCWAANHYVRAGATGSGTGADWTNAFTDLPASLVRGDLYYVAAGTYKPHLFGDSDSGTL